MNQTEIRELSAVYRDGLLLDTIPFWTRHAVDRARGGFLTFLDADGSVVSTDKPMWVVARTTWLFARLYNEVEPRDEWRELAAHGIDFLRRYGFDGDGRMFFSVTRDGRPLRKRRYRFTEAFGAIAFAEFARASGDAEPLDEARRLFRLIVDHHAACEPIDPKTNPTTRRLKSHAVPMILLATAQVLRACDDDQPIHDDVADAAIREVLSDFFKPEWNILLENVGPRGEFLDEPIGREVNPGHAIESAWFLMEAARTRGGDADLVEQACRILDGSLAIGWDEEYGGLFYFRDCKGLPCAQLEHDMKLWWPHTEAIYATLLAHHLTGEERYATWFHKLRAWSDAHFLDREHGEWFGYLHRDGTLASTLKGNLWKGPFHLPRMQLNCWKLLASKIAPT